jgi:hypothetical protein
MPIEVSVTDQNVQVSTSGQTVNASVSGGVGPTGPAGAAGATGATGPQGPAGPAGASAWGDITGKPATFSPSSHAASHAAAGSDPITVTQSQVTSSLGTANLQGDITQLSMSISTLGTAAEYDVPDLGDDATSSQVVRGSDTRLTNARTPTDGSVTAAKIASSAVTVAKLSATGTASASTFLRGDGAWAAAGSTSASDLTSGTLPEGRLPNLVILHPFLLAGM